MKTAGGIIKSIQEIDITNKTVLMRLDFNVPLKDGKIEDDTRIREALPTIKYAIEKYAKLVLCSHLGRPDGRAKPEYSLEPVALHLAELLGRDVTLADDCVGEGIEMMAKSLKNGQVLLLENLRFHNAEEGNDPVFCHKLARLGDVYINDAFGTSHRKHASTYGVAALMPVKGVGLLIEKEIKFLDKLVHHPEEPFYTILGGSKVSDKIKTIESLMKHVDGLLIGGAMMYAFWAAQGRALPEGAKKPSADDVEHAKGILRDAARREIPVLVAEDTVDAFDIGPQSVEKFSAFLQNAKTIFWNGPLGWFEKKPYDAGTFAIAEVIAGLSATKVVGGGDTVSAVHASGFAEKFDHLSTGGGAVLEYLEEGKLPGIEILKALHNKAVSKNMQDDSE